MPDVLGPFLDTEPKQPVEGLLINFSPSLTPLQQRWRNNGLSADFLADYVTTFLPRAEQDPAASARTNGIKAAVQYVANELLENAMKYSDPATPQPITIQLRLEPSRIIFVEWNTTSREQADRLRAFAARLLAEDPGALYAEQLERSATGEDGGSGLGLLTMVNDYEASLAWKFEDHPSAGVIVATQVSLSM